MRTSSFIFNFSFLIIKIIVFVAALIPAVNYIGGKYAAASTENLVNNFNQRRFEEFYSLPTNSLDIVFLGSSHSYCTFDPEIFDSHLGTSSFQMGMPLQHPDATYFTLLEVLRFQKPKLAVVEVYWDMLDDPFEIKQTIMLFQVLDNKALEQQYINEVFPLGEKIKYNHNILRYQADYFAFKSSELKKNIQDRFGVTESPDAKQEGVEEYRSKGFAYCDYNMLRDEFDRTNQFNNFDGSSWEFDKRQYNYLQRIVDKCKSEGITLVFATAPIANVSMEKIKNYNYINKAVSDFADKNNVKYIDYNIVNMESNLLTNDNFRDDAHLNYSGIQIVDEHFLNWLKEEGVIEDAFR